VCGLYGLYGLYGFQRRLRSPPLVSVACACGEKSQLSVQGARDPRVLSGWRCGRGVLEHACSSMQGPTRPAEDAGGLS
jgi:hypothetical protein